MFNIRIVLTRQLGGIHKEAVVGNLKMLSRTSCEGTKENQENGSSMKGQSQDF
jgi:hypothetical protein